MIWQKSNGLTADGLVGPMTYRRIWTERDSNISDYINRCPPEKDQSFAITSRQFLHDLIYMKSVTLEIVSKDKYGRIVAELFYENDNINQLMVKNGLAWWYRYYGGVEYKELEDYARRNKLGLWQAEDPIPPWKHRRYQKTKSRPKLKSKYIRFKKNL